MKMSFDLPISKAHSLVAKPKSIFFCSCNPHYFQLFYAPAKFDAVVLQHPVYKNIYITYIFVGDKSMVYYSLNYQIKI